MEIGQVLPSAADAPRLAITNLAYATDQVTPGTLFFCVRGFTRDGHDFAPQAIGQGAVALVVERPLGLGVPEVLVGLHVLGAMLTTAAAAWLWAATTEPAVPDRPAGVESVGAPAVSVS